MARMVYTAIIAVTLGCDATVVDSVSAEAVINEIDAEYKAESDALYGTMTVTVRNTGAHDLLWWSCPAILERQQSSGTWTGVYARPCTLVPRWVSIPVGQEATEIIGLPGGLGWLGTQQWAPPFSGAYRLSNVILARPDGTAILGARVSSPSYLFSMSGTDEP